MSIATEMVESPTFHSKRAEFFSEFRILEMPQLIQKYFPITLKLELKKYVRLRGTQKKPLTKAL